MAAIENGHLKSAEYLAKIGAELKIRDKSDQTIFHLAAKNYIHQVIEKMVQHKDGSDQDHHDNQSSIDENDLYDNTPLHLACSNGHCKTVEVLLNLGAAIENKDDVERTPFILAAKNGHVDVVEFLLERFEKKKVPLRKSGNENASTLQLAAAKNQIKNIL